MGINIFLKYLPGSRKVIKQSNDLLPTVAMPIIGLNLIHNASKLTPAGFKISKTI